MCKTKLWPEVNASPNGGTNLGSYTTTNIVRTRARSWDNLDVNTNICGCATFPSEESSESEPKCYVVMVKISISAT